MSELEEDNVIPIRKSDLARMIEADLSDEQNIITQNDDELRILNDMNSKHAFMRDVGGKPCVMVWLYDDTIGKKKISFQSVENFYLWYMNQTVPVTMGGGKVAHVELGKWWAKNVGRREYNTTVFDPEHKERDQYGALVKNGSLNTWSGLGIQPEKGSWKNLRRHIWLVLSNRDKAKFKYIIRWMAWCVQNPGKPAQVAIIFKGKKGTGKGLLANTLVDIFGLHGTIVSSRKGLTGEFNGHLENTSFVFADEAYYPGDKEVEGVIKSIITEPSLYIRDLHKKGKNVKNCLKIIMASNNDWVVPATGDERRFFINQVDDMYAMDGARCGQRNEYFDRIFRELDRGGKQAFLYDLLNMDLGRWHPRSYMPETSELKRQIFHGHSFAVKGIYELLQNGVFPGSSDLMAMGSAITALIEKIYPEYLRSQTQARGEALRSIGAEKKRAAKGVVWVFPPLHTCRQNWIKAHGNPPEQFLADENGEVKWKFNVTDF